MTLEEKKEVIKVVALYVQKKNEIEKERDRIIELQKSSPSTFYTGELNIIQLYKELEKSEECQRFIKITEKLEDNSEYEKYFRSTCLLQFLGINIDPSKL